MAQEPTLYERVWREAPPQSTAPNRVTAGKALGSLPAPRLTEHGGTIQQENSISQLIVQLDTWDLQEPSSANQTQESIFGMLKSLEARVARLQKICEEWQFPRNPQELSNLAAELTNQVNRMHSGIERRLELQQIDLAKRMEEMEASIRRRDLTFIESLVTVAELSWVRPDQDLLGSSLETSATPD